MMIQEFSVGMACLRINLPMEKQIFFLRMSLPPMSPCGEDVERCSVLEKVTRELLGVRRVLDLCNIIALCPFLMFDSGTPEAR